MPKLNKVFKVEFLLFGFIILIAGLFHQWNNYKIEELILNPSDHHFIKTNSNSNPHVVILGIAQDAGYPQANCKKECCTQVWKDQTKRKMVSCIGLRDPETKKAWIFDATPDFKDQLKILQEDDYELAGVFVTHAHMGHYTGLLHLGREAMGSDSVPVYAMPRMKSYLENNGPWSQLVTLENIHIKEISEGTRIQLTPSLSVVPFLVPHRDEFSETVGYKIISENKQCLFIPDIDKWSKWNTDINEEIKKVDYAFLDGTFFKNGEIWGRDMSQIPHPFIQESMARFSILNTEDKTKIRFIHLNHTNPLLNTFSEESIEFKKSGFQRAFELEVYNL